MSRASSYGMATTSVGRKDITFFVICKTYSKKNLRETIYKPICHFISNFSMAMQKFSAIIDAISDEAGFSSRTTFYRHFSEKYGLSPEELRKSIK